MTTTDLPTIQIRSARHDDEAGLLRLAALDSAAALHGPVLIATVDGNIRAALSLDDGRAIADPFTPTADLVELLHTRAGLLAARDGARPRRRLRRPVRTPVVLAR